MLEFVGLGVLCLVLAALAALAGYASFRLIRR